MSTKPAESRDDHVGNVYGSVKLKKTDKPSTKSGGGGADDSSKAYTALKLKRTGSANTKVASSARNDASNKNSLFQKDGSDHKSSYQVPVLKKATPIVRQTTFESKSSFDSFDSGKLRKVETAKRPVFNAETRKPSFSTDGLKSTGKMERTNSAISDDGSFFVADSSSDTWLSSVLPKVTSNTDDVQEKAVGFWKRIQEAGGEPLQRRLSISDNDLVTQLTRAVNNHDSLTPREISIESDDRFKNIKPDIVVSFAEGIRTNLHLSKLVIRNVGLGNDFLSALADSIRTNFMLEHVNLSNNAFTNDGLVDFCLGMAENTTLLHVDLSGQQSPIFTLREDLAVEALQGNTTVQEFQVEFQTADCSKAVRKILKRNQAESKKTIDYGTKLLEYLKKEAATAEKRQEERKLDVLERAVSDDDMPLLFALSEKAAQYKLPYETMDDATKPASASMVPTLSKTSIKTSLAKIAANIMGADGAFLTNDFISQYLVKDKDDGSLTFDFSNQVSVFKRFSVTDPARPVIVKKFVDALLDHPQARDITHISMVNTLIANDWLVYLCSRCVDDNSLLPKLHLVNLETNLISGPGVTALAKCVAAVETWKYLQAIKLDNQKQMISSDAEDDLARAMCTNRSVIKLSLRVRNIYERRRINKYLTRNIDFLRQARRWHAIKTGTVKERARSPMEKLFDRIAANDDSITSVEIVSDPLFLTLHPDEVIKAAQSFGTNSNVTTIKLSGLRLDDKFALAMAQSLQQNTAIVKLDLETNMFGTDGMIAIVSSLSTNRTVAEVFLRHQTKSLASADEERIPNLIADNPVIVKLSLDVRSTISKHSIESKLRQNQEKQRARNRAASAAQTDGGGSRSKSAARNRIQKIFDSVGANDSSITEVQVVCDQVFLSLNPAEILKTAESFAGNTHVRTVKLSGLRLDDAWAVVMAKSLESNTTIEAIDLESNAIGSTGMLALVATLASSTSSVTEFLLRHQSKPMSSVDEEQIPGLIGSNEKIVKLSMDVRGHKAKCFIDQKIRKNQELRRKNRNNKK